MTFRRRNFFDFSLFVEGEHYEFVYSGWSLPQSIVFVFFDFFSTKFFLFSHVLSKKDPKTNEKTKVKVTPSMLMTEVLQEYCKTKGIEVDRATLLHKSKPVDLSTPFRLTGLANNATLTLGQRASTAIPIVTVALQLENGSRVQAKVQVNNTLWQVLLGFEAQDAKLALTKWMQPEPAPERKVISFFPLSLLCCSAVWGVKGSFALDESQRRADGMDAARADLAQPTVFGH